MIAPPPTLTQQRRQWSEKLTGAAWWIEEARKEAKARDYKKSRASVLIACALLDDASQREILEDK